ncbi:high mobility group protein DSP1 isoform X3 [Diabrotica virgifera virgifera]|uniref:HMG box domain-containing protein n=1 Tax=Diabrotica virgifera virgifera TaxID=50390 RepID=A0ABM5IGF6_DIAVI|nr:high mobility group protein DSP1 isoform X3 [Diabrotica virgifera virgifera]
MSDHRSWGGREEGMWWPGAVAADQQNLQQHQQFFQQQQQQQQTQQQQVDDESNTQAQAFNYKMGNNFQNPATTVSNVTSTSPIGAAGIRGYDYSMTGGNPTLSAPAQGAQWWYPSSTMENMHNTLQNLQNSIHGMQQQMPPVQNPSSPVRRDFRPGFKQSEAHNRQDEQNRQHQDAVQRHQEAQRQQEVQRQHQEAQRQQQESFHHALSEAHARLQLNLQNNQLHNNHYQQGLVQALQQHQQILSQAPIPHKGRMPRAKADARPRGRMTAYAFFVQTCREEHKKKHPEENVVFAEFSKKCAERWKTMLDKEKKRFHEMAENDKKRYDTEMQSYTPPKGEKQRGKKRKQIKDPNAPKRSLSAFFWFSNDERGKVKAQNPEYGVGDIAKELGRRWAEADQEAKGKYEALADKDKARYEKEMTAYKKKNNPALQQVGHPVPEEDVDEEDEEVDEDEDE